MALELIEAGARIIGAAIVEYVLYPVGAAMLRVVSLGRYPRRDRPHNHGLISMLPLVVMLIIVTVAYS